MSYLYCFVFLQEPILAIFINPISHGYFIYIFSLLKASCDLNFKAVYDL